MGLIPRSWLLAARTAVTGAAIATLAACSGGSSPTPLASQIAPGSRVVPCSQIAGQISAILPYYYGIAGAADDGHLYERVTALAERFENVSNLDSPLVLSRAEVGYETDVLDGAYITQNDPYSAVVQSDIQALAAACGIQQ